MTPQRSELALMVDGFAITSDLLKFWHHLEQNRTVYHLYFVASRHTYIGTYILEIPLRSDRCVTGTPAFATDLKLSVHIFLLLRVIHCSGRFNGRRLPLVAPVLSCCAMLPSSSLYQADRGDPFLLYFAEFRIFRDCTYVKLQVWFQTLNISFIFCYHLG